MKSSKPMPPAKPPADPPLVQRVEQWARLRDELAELNARLETMQLMLKLSSRRP